MGSPELEGDHDDQDGDDSKTSRELADLRAAVAQLTEMVNELARRQRGTGAG
jgi:hypothetical protein